MNGLVLIYERIHFCMLIQSSGFCFEVFRVFRKNLTIPSNDGLGTCQ